MSDEIGALELVNEERIDVLYTWTGRRWMPVGEVRWATYWWWCYFLSDHVPSGDWRRHNADRSYNEHSRKDCGRFLLEYVKEHKDELMTVIDADNGRSSELQKAIAARRAEK